jgi:hypothetical protein
MNGFIEAVAANVGCNRNELLLLSKLNSGAEAHKLHEFATRGGRQVAKIVLTRTCTSFFFFFPPEN